MHFADGRPVPFATRNIYKTVLDRLGERGYDFVAGLEVECHIFKREETRMAPISETRVLATNEATAV